MTNINDLSRRQFLLTASAVSASAIARLSAASLAAIAQAACSARDRSSGFAVLGEEEAADFAAIASRIIPTTDTPGAAEAGVIHFLDRAFAAEMQASLDTARDGLAAVNAAIPGDRTFAALDADAQDDLLRAIETGAFFRLLRQMTIYGFFAMSEYGGNRDHVGWKLIGFEGHHGPWQYPFGHYDAQVHAEPADGE